jgi:hypothetical protein
VNKNRVRLMAILWSNIAMLAVNAALVAAFHGVISILSAAGSTVVVMVLLYQVSYYPHLQKRRSAMSMSDIEAAVSGLPDVNPDAVYFKGRPVAYDKEGTPISLTRVTELKYYNNDYMRIGLDYVGGVCISTVWLGFDSRRGTGPPLIFETIVFAVGSRARLCQSVGRYATQAEAYRGHWRTVRAVKKGEIHDSNIP